MRTLSLSPQVSSRPSPRICWRSDLTVPHESLWSRLHKVALLNQIAGRDLESLFFDSSVERVRAYDRGWAMGDLSVIGCFDREKIRNLSAESGEATLGVICEYVREAANSRFARERWAHSNLRFCPACIELGVHVTYFQLMILRSCPVHEVQLTNGCPVCHRAIPYELPPLKAYSCACGHVLFDWLQCPIARITDETRVMHQKAGDGIKNALKESRTCLWQSWEQNSHEELFASPSLFQGSRL